MDTKDKSKEGAGANNGAGEVLDIEAAVKDAAEQLAAEAKKRNGDNNEPEIKVVPIVVDSEDPKEILAAANNAIAKELGAEIPQENHPDDSDDNDSDDKGKKGGRNKKRSLIENIIYWGFYLTLLFISAFGPTILYGKDISYTEFVAHLEADEISEINISENEDKARLILRNEKKAQVHIASTESTEEMIMNYVKEGHDIKMKITTNEAITILKNGFWFVFRLFLISAVVLAFYKLFSDDSNSIVDVAGDIEEPDDQDSSGEKSKGNSKNRFGKKKNNTFGQKIQSHFTYDSISLLPEERAEVEQIVDYLKDPEKYRKIGADMPRGILLMGPPGCGKTLLSYVIAGEAGVPMYCISGSSFDEVWVGLGSMRIRKVMSEAEKNGPSVVFIDEIDTVGRKRYGAQATYNEQTLNQFLVAFDGLNKKSNVIIIAATNHPEVLDPALTRPGRFDKKIHISLPDLNGRLKILALHAKSKRLADSVDLQKIAKKTSGFSGADLKNLLNEAALLAVSRGSEVIEPADIDSSFIKVIVGIAKVSAVIDDKQRYETAIHESGHAICQRALAPDLPILSISIIPRGNALGFNIFSEDETIQSPSKDRYINTMAVSYGGYAAEFVTFKTVGAGVYGDMQSASKIAEAMVTQFGMGNTLLSLTGDQYFDELIVAKTYGKAEAICKEAMDKAKRVITANQNILKELAELLMQKEDLTAEEVAEFFNTHPLNLEF